MINMNETEIVSGNKVPSNLAQVRITLKYTLLEYIRSRRFYILLAIAIVISAILTFVVGYYRPASFLASDLSFYSGWWGNIATFVIVLSGIFFGGDAISGEFQNKTGYFGVPNPIRRSSIYIGKWLSALIASTVILGVFAAITVGNGLYYFSSVPYPIWRVLAVCMVLPRGSSGLHILLQFAVQKQLYVYHSHRNSLPVCVQHSSAFRC